MVERGDDGRMVLPCALGRYRLLHQVGQGGAAAVYVASMTGKGGFERTVAVKVLHRHLTSDPSFVTMFLDEARLCAGIRHPNVVDVYDVDAISGELIIVMEYVEGLALNKLLAKGAPALPIPLGLRINHDALRGLHAAHELKAADGGLVGLIHRDMTPHNVLVGVDGVVRLADFGIAKARGRITNTDSTGIVKGKLRYLAPEQLNPESPADRRLDVFAAGIVLWETLCHRPLFSGDSEPELLADLLAGTIKPPSDVNKTVPAEVDEICMKALARRREDRFESAEAFADALEENVGDHMASARKVGRWISERAAARLDQTRDAVKAARPIPDAVPSSETAVRLVRSSDPEASGGLVAIEDVISDDGSTGHDMPSVSLTWNRKTLVTTPWRVVAALVLGGLMAAAWFALRDVPLTAQAGLASTEIATPEIAPSVSVAAPAAMPSKTPSAQPAPSTKESAPVTRPRPRPRVKHSDDLPTGI